MGRHSKPESHHRVAKTAAIATSGAFAAIELSHPGMAVADTPNNPLDAVAQCESGGNPTAQNPHSTASGTYQMLDSTWAAYGGRQYGPRAKDATPEQQTLVAERLYAADGLSPWAASEGCWGRRVHSNVAATPPPTGRGEYVVRSGDTLSDVAARYGLTWQEVFAANREVVQNPDLIHAGLRIRL